YQEHRLGFAVFYSTRRKDTNAFPNDDAHGFALFNLFGSGRLDRRFSYAFGVDNVFDTRVFDPAADFGNQYNTERSEREIWGRIKWSFDP
ncbi:MAG: hypothetical protein ACU84J_03995, partial [Gammaproteobacteria bacterium]